MFSDVVGRARAQGRDLLNEIEAKDALREAGIPVVDTTLARTADEAVAQAEAAGYPVALKIVSPDIIHKSDAGGVQLGLKGAAEVRTAFGAITGAGRAHLPGARVTGAAVQRMAPQGVEVIVGLTTDPQFGPVVMFGLGGIMVEVLGDVAFRLVPVSAREAAGMIDEIRGRPVLDGVRGQPAADITAVAAIIQQLSHFAEAHPEVQEVDLNPVFVYRDGALAVDARILLAPAAVTAP